MTGSDWLAFTGVVLAALIGVTIPIHGLIESRRRQAERAKTAEKAHEVALEILSQRTSDKELDYQHLSDKLGVIVFAKQSLPTVFAPLFLEIEALSCDLLMATDERGGPDLDLLRKRSERIVSLTEALADYHGVKARAPRRKGR